jgi:type II secretory pathway component PulJ
MRRQCGAAGFTLIELILALGIAAAVLVIVFGGLRVALAAWSKGEERAATLDHARSVVVLLERALTGAFPYQVSPDDDEPARILFEGLPDRLTFVTLSPPFPAATPRVFTVVSLAGDGPGLVLRQQVLPNRLALDRLAPILVDLETSALRFRYRGENPNFWQGEWDADREEALPRAVEITLVTGARGVLQSFTVPIQTTAP